MSEFTDYLLISEYTRKYSCFSDGYGIAPCHPHQVPDSGEMRRLWASRLRKHVNAFEDHSVVNREDRDRMDMLMDLAQGEDVPEILERPAV